MAVCILKQTNMLRPTKVFVGVTVYSILHTFIVLH